MVDPQLAILITRGTSRNRFNSSQKNFWQLSYLCGFGREYQEHRDSDPLRARENAGAR